jgi:hypothetical protein
MASGTDIIAIVTSLFLGMIVNEDYKILRKSAYTYLCCEIEVLTAVLLGIQLF